MKDKKIWLASPYMHKEEQEFVQEAFDTNWVSTVGENINSFEKDISKYLGNTYSVALSSGTSAIHMAIKCANVKQGDKVFVSDLTFSATVNPIVYEGGIPVFIDSEYESWNMDPQALEKAFLKYPEVKVVVLVHLYGVPANVAEIANICEKHGAILIEDAAESLGATYHNKQTGTFGKYNIISFNGNKIITTSSGGMFLTDDKEKAELVRKWSTQSREQAPWYQHKELGYNYRMSNILAGIGRGQLMYLQDHINRKKHIYDTYKKAFKDLPIQMQPHLDHTIPNYWLSCMLINKEAMCIQNRSDTTGSYIKEHHKTCPTEILETLLSYNIEGRPMWKPMHMQPIFKDYDYITINRVSEDLFNRGLCLPSDINMSDDDQERIISIIKHIFEL